MHNAPTHTRYVTDDVGFLAHCSLYVQNWQGISNLQKQSSLTSRSASLNWWKISECNDRLARSNNTQKNHVLINKPNQFFSELVSVSEEGHKLNCYTCREVSNKQGLVCFITHLMHHRFTYVYITKNATIFAYLHNTFSLNRPLQATLCNSLHISKHISFTALTLICINNKQIHAGSW